LAASHDTDPGVVGGDNYSTYHIDIPKDVALTGTTGHEFWVVAESSGYNYINVPGVSAPPASSPLASFWRFPLFVASGPYNEAPVCDLDVVTSMPASGWVPVPVEFDASGSTDPDPGDVLTYEWDFDGDLVYDENPDDIYTGTETNPTHVYTGTYTGAVNVRVKDQMNAESVCTSPNLDISIDTTCGTMNPITGSSTTFIGSARLYAYPPEGTQAASPEKVLGSPNGSAAYIAAIDPNSTAMPFQAYNTSGYSFYNLAVTSSDKIYYNDSGSSNIIYYMDYSNSTGFTNIRTASSFGAIPSGTIHKLVLDQNDYPVVLTQTYSIYHWNGTTWGSAIAVPASVQTAAGSYSLLNDMDYDPTTGYFILVERNGNPGVYAVTPDGTLAWSDEDIWAGVCSGWDAGVEVWQPHAECAIVLGCGLGGGGAPSTPFYFARINPMGGEKVTSSITNAVPYGYTFSMADGNGALMKVGSAYRWYSNTYGGNVWGYATMPSGF
ncbi:MAG: PKD domain-containing protein, partial [bacterium]|nr:PKD domain-containing protein [bacterium]